MDNVAQGDAGMEAAQPQDVATFQDGAGAPAAGFQMDNVAQGDAGTPAAQPQIADMASEITETPHPEPQVKITKDELKEEKATTDAKDRVKIETRSLIAEIRTMKFLGEVIEFAIESARNFYIGVTKNEMEMKEMDVLYAAAEATSVIWSKHPADVKATNDELKLVNIVRTQPVKTSALKIIYTLLISKYFQDILCINDNSEIPTAAAGYVYVRIYDHKYRCNYHMCKRSFKTEAGLLAHRKKERTSLNKELKATVNKLTIKDADK